MIKKIDSVIPEERREEYYNNLLKVPFFKYDMSKVNTVDVQAIVYLVDTNIKYPSLKNSESYYLGWRGNTFEETLGEAENFFYLTPEEAYQYAATDALGTFLLAIKLNKFLLEAKTSGILDTKCLMPLTRFENETTLIDVETLKSYSKYYDEEIRAVEERVRAAVGSPERFDKKGNLIPWNLGSNKDKNEMLKKLNIYTGVKTKTGADSTSSEAIDVAISHLKKDDPNRKFLLDLQSYGTLSKQRSSYVDNTLEMCDNPLHRNRLRFSYKTTEVPSGRLAAGGDKKNTFFAGLNIQNIPKPHVKMWFTEKEELAYQRFPGLKENLDMSGTLEECDMEVVNADGELQLAHFYRIFGWVFADTRINIDGVQEKLAEGFDQKLNVRSVFLPDPGHYWISCLALNTLVEIDDGRKVPITFFKDKDNRDKYKIKTLKSFAKVNAFLDRGIKPECILKTENGLELHCTEDHKILTVNEDGFEEWKEAKDILETDYIITNRGGVK